MPPIPRRLRGRRETRGLRHWDLLSDQGHPRRQVAPCSSQSDHVDHGRQRGGSIERDRYAVAQVAGARAGKTAWTCGRLAGTTCHATSTRPTWTASRKV